MLTDAQMYKALVDKDVSYEGIFIAAVKTTGIFCRPSCTARKPNKKNVEFFKMAKEALIRGYRPCKVCHPLEMVGETPDYIKAILIELSNSLSAKLRDSDLRSRGIEPNKLRRWFLKNHNMTFHSYQRMSRINTAFKKIQNGEAITSSAFESGYESLSGFNDSFKSIFGVSPTNGKGKQIINITRLETPIGTMFACAVEGGICLLEFSNRRMLETELKSLVKLLNANIFLSFGSSFENILKANERNSTSLC